MKNCLSCKQKFKVLPGDRGFYKKMSQGFAIEGLEIPAPTLCPRCRTQRRLSFRNEKNFYKRKCDFSGKDIISVYSPEKPFKVYDQKVWWSDDFDPLKYGKDFDFDRPFFEQFGELMKAVPRLSLINRNAQNSEYCNICDSSKNCYMLVESSNNEDCLYGYWLQKCKSLVDCSFCNDCEKCYECDNCDNCYDLNYSYDCKNCYDGEFLESCVGCKNCFACMNLMQKEFYIFNEKYSKQDYEEKVLELKKKSFEELRKDFGKYFEKEPRKFAQIIKSEDCSGDYISNSRDCQWCFHADDAEHCKFAVHVWRNSKFAYDCDTVGRDCEWNYECINTAINSYGNAFCNRCWTTANCLYCNDCDNSKNLFGCIGLNHKEFCILNKQSSEKEYREIVGKIIEQMKIGLEWGEFFPMEISPFEYEESAANEFFTK